LTVEKPEDLVRLIELQEAYGEVMSELPARKTSDPMLGKDQM
jgi:hypothetical protein